MDSLLIDLNVLSVMPVMELINDYLWTYVVIVLLVFCALFFTIRLRGVQFRLLRDMWKVIVNRPIHPTPSSATDHALSSDDAADELKRIGSRPLRCPYRAVSERAIWPVWLQLSL